VCENDTVKKKEEKESMKQGNILESHDNNHNDDAYLMIRTILLIIFQIKLKKITSSVNLTLLLIYWLFL
jgi:hypothetical protein